MISVAVIILRSLFHLYFSASFELFVKYNLGLKISKIYVVSFVFVATSIKEYFEYRISSPDAPGSIYSLIRDAVSILIVTTTLVLIRRNSVTIKRSTLYLWIVSLILLVFSYVFTYVYISDGEHIIYKHYLDIASTSLGPVIATPILERMLQPKHSKAQI